jgi:hypothetical protein
MAFNQSPKVKMAKEFGKEFDSAMVIIFYVPVDGSGLGYASWGKDKTLCKYAKEMADVGFEAMMES